MAQLIVAKRATAGASYYYMYCDYVMILKINFFQFSNNNLKKYLNRFYYNNIKGKLHKLETHSSKKASIVVSKFR